MTSSCIATRQVNPSQFLLVSNLPLLITTTALVTKFSYFVEHCDRVLLCIGTEQLKKIHICSFGTGQNVPETKKLKMFFVAFLHAFLMPVPNYDVLWLWHVILKK